MRRTRSASGDGPVTSLVCGAVRFDHPAARTLGELLPNLIHLAALDASQSDWMYATLRLVAAEARQPQPGGEAIIRVLGMSPGAVRRYSDSPDIQPSQAAPQ